MEILCEINVEFVYETNKQRGHRISKITNISITYRVSFCNKESLYHSTERAFISASDGDVYVTVINYGLHYSNNQGKYRECCINSGVF